MQHKLQYDTGVAMQECSTTLVVQYNTGKLAKTVHPDSFHVEPSSL